jgi:hypothetical protein
MPQFSRARLRTWTVGGEYDPRPLLLSPALAGLFLGATATIGIARRPTDMRPRVRPRWPRSPRAGAGARLGQRSAPRFLRANPYRSSLSDFRGRRRLIASAALFCRKSALVFSSEAQSGNRVSIRCASITFLDKARFFWRHVVIGATCRPL